MRHFGIIGNPLKQSFSAKYFTEKFAREGISAEYSLYPTESEDVLPSTPVKGKVEELFRRLEGMNVTIPYKVAIIPMLDELDDTARAIGAVNVIKVRHLSDGSIHTTGYNTDCLGFIDSIRPYIKAHHTRALVLGTGGAAKAVTYGLHQLGIETQAVSRTKGLTYEALTPDIIRQHTVIVNCTPLGMWPDTDAAADIPYSAIGPEHLMYDCIYNPEKTLFLQRGEQQGATVVNGIGMLHGQAEAAWRIWCCAQ